MTAGPVNGDPSPATSASGERSSDLRDLRWLTGVWVLVALFACVTAYWSHHVGIPLRDPHGTMFRGRLATALVLFCVLTLLDALIRTRKSGWSVRATGAMLRARWPLRRLALAISGLLAYHIVYICYRNLKSWDALNQVRDDDLLAFERWVFLGHSPAVLLHDLLGQHVAAYVLMVFYTSFTYLVTLSVVGSLVFVDRIRDGYVFITSALWVWILGVGSYYLIPTLGPFASAPQEFAGLTHTRITSTQAKYLSERAHLLANPQASDAFVSISAFASLHIAFTCMVLLMMRYYGRRRVAQVLTVYLAAIAVATVYFGMHFVVDDFAGVALAALAVLFARLMIYPRGRPLPLAPEPDQP